MTDPIGFLGLTHLGVVMSACWAHLGHEVVAVGEPVAVTEPGMDTLGGRDRLTFVSDPDALAPCPVVFVTLDTSDPVAVDRLVGIIPVQVPARSVVVMSQVPPGTTRRLAATYPGHAIYYLAETLITGWAVQRCLHPARFIFGTADPSWSFSPIGRILPRFGCPIFDMSYESAEFAKIAINLYLASSIAYANRMVAAARFVGAKWEEIIPALRLDPRIGLKAYLLPGEVGPNIGRDIWTLEQLEAQMVADAPLWPEDGSPVHVTRTLGECNRAGKLKFQREKWVPAAGEDLKLVIDIKFQDGPLTNAEANGCQLEDVIDVLVDRLQGFQRGPFRCRENALAITKLQEARLWLSQRNWTRQSQGVEGSLAPHDPGT